MAHVRMLDGNAAAAEAIKAARPAVIAAYPITPQSAIAEKLSEMVGSGALDARYVRVESEHTAMSVTLGAQLTGVRAATATASVGLALMHEIVNAASGVRAPIVMPVVNRSLASPWSLWCDHTDAMSERDSGWLQLYCENVQEVYDLCLAAYRIAEDASVLTPAMVCLDGFFLSHSMQKVTVEEQAEIDAFIGPYVPRNTYLNPEDPMVVNNLTPSSDYTEMKLQQKRGFDAAIDCAAACFDEFYRRFGRRRRLVEGYCLEDATYVVVTLGSMSGTAKAVVNELRAEGVKAGALKIVLYRPFPSAALRACLTGKRVAVLERMGALGAKGGPLYLDVMSALGGAAIVRDYVAGLAGRDVSPRTIRRVFEELRENDGPTEAQIWIDAAEDPMTIREVARYV